MWLKFGYVVVFVEESPKECCWLGLVCCEGCELIGNASARHKVLQLFFSFTRILRVEYSSDIRVVYGGQRLVGYGLFRKVADTSISTFI